MLVAAGLATPATARQDDVYVRPEATAPVTPDALAMAQDAARRGDPAEALSRYLRVLASAPDNVAALVGAGQAALTVGDGNAAAGFLARADALDPRNGSVKAGLAETMLQKGDARAALRLFQQASDLGVPPTTFAADRGLAYDLRGASKRAQAEYQLALRTKPDDETLRRLALSQAIGGDRAGAMATLDPLLRKQDVPAWRTRAFVLALTGAPGEAVSGAALVMPPDQVAALSPYLTRLGSLKAADKAAAIHLGRFPGEKPASQQQAASASSARPRLPIDSAALVPIIVPPPLLESGPVAPAPIRVASTFPGSAMPLADPAEQARERAQATADAKAAARAEAKDRAAAKARSDAAAREKKERAAEAEERAAAKANPARHWVQVAGGANKSTLPRSWADLKEKWPKQLAGRSPWTLHYRFTNRLLIGPFASSDAAQDWVSDRAKEGMSAFRVETNAGDPVERVK